VSEELVLSHIEDKPIHVKLKPIQAINQLKKRLQEEKWRVVCRAKNKGIKLIKTNIPVEFGGQLKFKSNPLIIPIKTGKNSVKKSVLPTRCIIFVCLISLKTARICVKFNNYVGRRNKNLE
jgi:hypothetical protein